MKRSLFALLASTVLAGAVFAQTASPAVNTTVNKATAAAATIANPIKPVVTPAPQAASAPATKASPAQATQAVGGGAGKVWVNGKVYHCEGTKYYGKTKKGEYMSEAEAKAKGAHGVKGQACV